MIDKLLDYNDYKRFLNLYENGDRMIRARGKFHADLVNADFSTQLIFKCKKCKKTKEINNNRDEICKYFDQNKCQMCSKKIIIIKFPNRKSHQLKHTKRKPRPRG